MNLLTVGYSLSVGWISSAFLLYDSDDCPLPSGRVSMSEIAWIGSIIGIGGLIGTIVMGWFADQFGRKNSMLAMAIPQIVSTETCSLPLTRVFCADYKPNTFQHSIHLLQSMDLCISVSQTFFRLAFC